MKTLHIQDLSIATELSHADMASVQGGFGKDVYAQYMSSMPHLAKPVTTFDATQQLAQAQDTTVNNGNNAAFVCGIKADVNPHQTGTNSINFG